ncbi:MAG: response regulator transcription factor [Actinomycetes bacterium]|jgi:DNA-binding response OmpR family regulator|nr:response regulator transcription factor [Actinomycetes bacterium]
MSYHVLIVEDDPLIARELGELLERYGYEVSLLTDFKQVVADVLSARAHLVLLDLNLPFFDGYHICRELRKQSDIPLIVVTSRDTEFDELMSLNLGADQFITKPYNTQILLAKISALLSRSYEGGRDPVLRFKDLVLDLAESRLEYRGQSVELSKNELGILRALIQQQGGIVSRADLMYALWDSDSFIDDNTLTVNINRLRRKLASLGAEEVLRTRRGQGYSL